jgi:hypothetical protein
VNISGQKEKRKKEKKIHADCCICAQEGFGGLVIKGLTAMRSLNHPHGYKRLIALSREGA